MGIVLQLGAIHLRPALRHTHSICEVREILARRVAGANRVRKTGQGRLLQHGVLVGVLQEEPGPV